MSYILDALKKAAEQRGAGTTALLRPAAPLARGSRLGRLPWVIIGVLLLLNLAGAIYLMRPEPAVTPPPPAPVAPKVALIQPVEPPPPAPTQVIPAEPPRPAAPPRAVEPRRPSPPVRPAAPSTAPAVRPAPPFAQSAPPAAPTLPGTVGGPALTGAPPAEKPVVRTTPDARVTIARPDPVPPAAAGPAPARANAQRFKLEVLSYSDVPAQRLVFINGRRYREGEMLDGGVKIEEIREDSVILSDAGQRFTLR